METMSSSLRLILTLFNIVKDKKKLFKIGRIRRDSREETKTEQNKPMKWLRK